MRTTSHWAYFTKSALAVLLASTTSCGHTDKGATEQETVVAAQKKSERGAENRDVSRNLNTPVGKMWVEFMEANKDMFKNSILLDKAGEDYVRRRRECVKSGGFNGLTYKLLSLEKVTDWKTGKEYNEADFAMSVVGKDSLFVASYAIFARVPDSMLTLLVTYNDYRITGAFFEDEDLRASAHLYVQTNWYDDIGEDYPAYAHEGSGMATPITISDTKVNANVKSIEPIAR